MTPHILLVEDDEAIALVVEAALGAEAMRVTVAPTLSARDAALAAGGIDAMITDVVLPDGDGIVALSDPVLQGVPVIVVSAQNTLDTAVRAAGNAAYEYLPKPIDLDALVDAVRGALRNASAPVPQSTDTLPSTPEASPIIGRAPAMQAVYRTIARVAPNQLSVLILGESGTGKELVARAIHAASPRRDRPFVAINMAAIPRELIEAELFGHERGAFTGAVARHAGRFEQAAGGTLFLDEIGDMPFEAQTRLLRVLQVGEFSPVGSQASRTADVRVLAATHQDLGALVADGRFREDLYYRLNVIPIELPPLRERRSDIAALTAHFLSVAAGEGLGTRTISDAAIALLERHDWPGNVREMENLIRRLVVLGRDHEIGADEVAARLPVSGDPAEPRDGDVDAAVSAAVAAWTRAALAAGDEAGDLHARLVECAEDAMIAEVMASVGGNQLRAADRMGINRNTLRKKLSRNLP